MSVGVMEDYKLRDLRASHTLGRSWNWNTYVTDVDSLIPFAGKKNIFENRHRSFKEETVKARYICRHHSNTPTYTQ
jgi:hypothetical protein